MVFIGLVIVLCSVVQSVFGVGLLVFGTPTLLLMGYSFEQSLAYLLPCSLVISVLQLMLGDGVTLDFVRRKFITFTAPAVLAATLFVLIVLPPKVDLKPLVGAMLLVTAALRTGPMRDQLKGLVRRHLTALLVFLGLIHGATNLGGGLLTAMMGSLHDSKESTRRQIAFCYGLMAAIQLSTLALTVHDVHWNPLLPVLAAITYLLVGRYVYEAAREAMYQHALTGIIGAYGVLLIVNP
jgi:hypothetical protein